MPFDCNPSDSDSYLSVDSFYPAGEERLALAGKAEQSMNGIYFNHSMIWGIV